MATLELEEQRVVDAPPEDAGPKPGKSAVWGYGGWQFCSI